MSWISPCMCLLRSCGWLTHEEQIYSTNGSNVSHYALIGMCTFSLARSSSNMSWISSFQSSWSEWKESCGISCITCSSRAVSCCRMQEKFGRRCGSWSQHSDTHTFITISLLDLLIGCHFIISVLCTVTINWNLIQSNWILSWLLLIFWIRLNLI